MQKHFSSLMLSLLAVSATIQAEEIKPPSVYGNILGQLRFEDTKDYQSEIHAARLGLIGKHKAGSVFARYILEAEYAEDLTEKKVADQDFDLRVSEAKLYLMNKSLGTLLLGNGTTGVYKDMYSLVDIFDSNNMRSSSNASLYRQSHSGNNQFAYGSPVWNGFQFKGAIISPDNGNDNDVDVFGVRGIYRQDNFSFIIHRAQIDQKMLPPHIENDFVRYTLASHFQNVHVYLAGLVEFNQDDPTGDNVVYGLSGKYTYDKFTFKVGSQLKHFDQSEKQDESLYLANISYSFDKQFSTFIEVAEYAEDSKNDNINIGLNFKF